MIYPKFSETFLNKPEDADTSIDPYLTRFEMVGGDSSEEEQEDEPEE